MLLRLNCKGLETRNKKKKGGFGFEIGGEKGRKQQNATEIDRNKAKIDRMDRQTERRKRKAVRFLLQN